MLPQAAQSQIQALPWTDIPTAPTEPGLYAWYVDPRLREADLHDKDETLRNIVDLATQLRIPNMDVTADGHLSLQLVGRLNHIHVGYRVEEGITGHIDKILTSQPTRELFAGLLGVARPFLMAPLYIGVATNLRDRLGQHRAAIESPAEIDAAPDYPPAHSFAREVRLRNIPPRRLFVHVLPVPAICDPATPIATQREVAEAVETLLNRLFYPILGRR